MLQNPPTRLLRGSSLFLAVLCIWIGSIGGIWLWHGVLSWGSGLLYVAYDTWLIAYVAVMARRAIAESRGLVRPAPPAGYPGLSVIVASRNEASVLATTLDAVLLQLLPTDEVLVVDDGSTDGTSALMEQSYGVPVAEPGICVAALMRPNLRVLRKQNSGKADSLNQALRAVHCEVVITLDADTILEAGALQAMRAAFAAEPELAAVCGVLKPTCGGGLEGRFFQWFQSFEYLRAFLSRVAWMRADALLLVSGAFAGYRRSVLEKIKGFDPACLVEDYELIHRLHRYAGDRGLNWQVRVLADAVASTDAPGTLIGFLRQRRRWFAGFLQTQYRNRDMTGNPRYGRVGRFMLPIKLVDTLQPIYGLTAFVLLVSFVVRGSAVLKPVLIIILAKIVVDLSFQLWALRLYNRWMQRRPPPQQWLLAALASLAEPFSFQLMRHTGALLGWFAILTRRLDWAPQRPTSPAQIVHQDSAP